MIGFGNHLGDGLSLQQIRSERRYLEGGMQLVVEGEIHNESKGTRQVPDLQITALGPDGNIMQSWRIDAPAATLDPGASAPFQSAVNTPQGTVTEVNLKFIEPRHDP